MTLTKYPNGVSSFGLPVIGGAFTSTGKAFFVDSNTGSNSYDGLSKSTPFGTVTYALTKCTANKGDIIYCMPGHIEAAGGITINKAGVSIIGIGDGYLRPRFQLPATSDEVTISSCDVTIQNLVVFSTVAAVAQTIAVNADDCTIFNCEYQMTETTMTPLLGIVVSTSADRCTIDGFKMIIPSTTNATGCSPIRLNGGSNHLIQNCFLISGLPSTDGLIASGTSVNAATMKNLLIRKNICAVLTTSSSAAIIIDPSSGNVMTGIIADNYMGYAMVTSSTQVATFFGDGTEDQWDVGFINNYCAEPLGNRGMLYPNTVSATA